MQSLNARLVVFTSTNRIGNAATFQGKNRLDWKSDDGLPVESVTGAEALHAGDVADTLRRAVALSESSHCRYLRGGRGVFPVCSCCKAGKRGHEIVSFQRSSPRDSRCVAIGSDVRRKYNSHVPDVLSVSKPSGWMNLQQSGYQVAIISVRYSTNLKLNRDHI